MVGSDFAPGVCLGLVEQTDVGSYSFVPFDTSAGLVSEPVDSQKAPSNLAGLREGSSKHAAHAEKATVMWITAKDNCAAVRMLIPSIQAQLISELGEQVLFTIPSRDVCLFWNADAPPDLTSKHAREAMEDFGSEEYNLTSRVLVYSDIWPCTVYTS
jgi:hypothetical protein